MVIEEQGGAGTPGEPPRSLSRVCDAADFFSKEYLDTVRGELQGVPALSRKQWEFVRIIASLKHAGFLREDAVGLSMGSGNETVLYAIARRVRHLTVTDLYSSDSSWDGARSADPDEHVRKSKPFPVDDERLSVLNMDMRDLSFEDGSFDFAYSSCAFEHIGVDADFIRHLREVHRVLKGGGVYVMTTEFTFHPTTIPIPNNYLFSADHLNRLIAASGFTPERSCDARITEQSANFPIPGQVDDLSYLGEDHFARTLVTACVIPHVQLLYGKHPFTSCILVLKKEASPPVGEDIVFSGLAESRAFLDSCVSHYRAMIQSNLSLNPFSFQPGGRSSYFAPHAGRASSAGSVPSDAVFHTNYFWYGEGARRVRITLSREGGSEGKACIVELRVHGFRLADPSVVECSYSDPVPVLPLQELRRDMVLVTKDDYVYAVLARPQLGSCLFSDIRVLVTPFVTV